MFKAKKYWKKKYEQTADKEFEALLERELALTLLRRLIQALEVDGFGHVKDIHAGEATAVYHEYLDEFITKN
ncbi:hypothetical protein [Flavobacterium sp.]|jgi:hypothetical protein|uniref:hypothetical protein n=1 Tax=Flavobacterium sp. TaxID=239 RepID=UPI0037BFD2EE